MKTNNLTYVQMSMMGRVCEGISSREGDLYRIVNHGHELSVRQIQVGIERGQPGYDFAHTLVSETKFEFKHSSDSGAKWWTSSPGRNFAFNIRADSIFVCVDEYWSSYVRARINGADLVFSVDSSSFRENGQYGSADVLSDGVLSTLINHPPLVLERLAEFHVPGDLPKPKMSGFDLAFAPLGFGD